MQVIKEMVNSSKKTRNSIITFMYLIARRAWCPSRKWKSKVSGWHSSMARYVIENIFFKNVLEFRVVSSPLGTMSIDSTPEVCESDGDRDA